MQMERLPRRISRFYRKREGHSAAVRSQQRVDELAWLEEGTSRPIGYQGGSTVQQRERVVSQDGKTKKSLKRLRFESHDTNMLGKKLQKTKEAGGRFFCQAEWW